LIFLVFIQFSGMGQDAVSKIDSLTKVIANTMGNEKFEAITALMRLQVKTNPAMALGLSRQAESIALQSGDSLQIVRSKFARGFIYRRMDSLGQAIQVLMEALPIAKRNKYDDELSKILNTTALAYSFSGNPDKALTFHFQSIELNERLGRNEEIAITYNNIGLVYFKLNDYDNSLIFYQKSLDLKKSISDNYDLDRLYINMALCFNQLKRYEDSESFVKEGLKICKDNCDPFVRMDAELCLGISLSEQRKGKEAIPHFEASLQLSKQLSNKRYQIESLLNLAIVKETEGQEKEAIAFLTEAEEIAKYTNYSLSLIEIYKIFSRIYVLQSNFEKSSQYQSRYIKLKDSIYSDELIKNLAKVQTKFAERENIKTIKEQDLILELRQQLIDRQRTQFVFVVVITLLSLGLVLLLLITNRKQKQTSAIIAMARNKIAEQNKQLEEQNQVLDQKVKERTLELSESNRQLIDVNTELDNFLYKSSHDLRGPLATLQGLINLAHIEPKDEDSVIRLLGNLTAQTEKMSKMLSRLSLISDLSQSLLMPEKIDLGSTLAHLVESEKKSYQSSNIELTFKIIGQVELVSDQLLFETIVENLVTNGIKFCKNTERVQPFVHIELSREGAMVCIRVSDNGIGITNKPAAEVFRLFMRGSDRSETGGVGLYLSKVCVDRLGGEIQLEKSSGEGSTFLVQLPTDLTPILNERRRLQDVVRRKEREAFQEVGKLTSTD
jgi:signal transduction histidine kinase